MFDVTKIIEIINANGRQGPKDLKSHEVFGWVSRSIDISYDDYLAILRANAIPYNERQRFRNAYFTVSPSGVYSFFKSTEEELRPYIAYVIYDTPNLTSAEIKQRLKAIYPRFTLIDQMYQQNLSAPQCVVDQTIRNVLVSNYERQANRELFERTPIRPYTYSIKPAGEALALQVKRELESGTVGLPGSMRSWVRDQGPALIIAQPYSADEMAAIEEKNQHYDYQMPQTGCAEHRDRDFRLKATRIAQANYRCCIDEKHVTFATPNMPNFIECHHIVPLAAQREIPNINLDRLENLAPLCPVCHSAIHCGTPEVQNAIFEKLLDLYGDELERVGISRDTAREMFARYSE